MDAFYDGINDWQPDEWDVINANEADDYRNESHDEDYDDDFCHHCGGPCMYDYPEDFNLAEAEED